MIEEDLLADLDYLESCLDETRNAILKVIELANAKLDAEEVDRLRAKKKQIYEDLKSEQTHNMKGEVTYDPETGEPLIDGYPLYSGLPKREWVGLTDEEVGTLTVFDGLHDVETPLLADFARAIEAKLKEKNA